MVGFLKSLLHDGDFTYELPGKAIIYMQVLNVIVWEPLQAKKRFSGQPVHRETLCI